MNIEDLVPPLELCQKIPDGEFKNSAFSYAYNIWIKEPKELFEDILLGYTSVVKTKDGFSCHETNPSKETWDLIHQIAPHAHVCKAHYPAPTLQEIMENLPKDDAYNNLLLGHSAKIEKLTGWHIYYIGDRKRHCYDKNAVTAALKLWLKQKGIE